MAGKPAKRSLGFTPKKRETFLALVAKGYTVTDAVKQVGLSRRAVYYLRDRDPDFAERLREAYEASSELLEAGAFQRAMGRDEVTGVDKDGQPIFIKKYSDVLLIFLLKARKPEVYRDRVDVNVTETREIVVNLLPVEKGPDGRLRLAGEVMDVPVLGTGEGAGGCEREGGEEDCH